MFPRSVVAVMSRPVRAVLLPRLSQPQTQRTFMSGCCRRGQSTLQVISTSLSTTMASPTYDTALVAKSNKNAHIRTCWSTRSYHATCAGSLQVRRRRRGGGLPTTKNLDVDDTATSRTQGKIRRVKDPVEFEAIAKALLDKVYAALAPLKALNDPYTLSRGRDPEQDNDEYILLDLGPLQGQYTLHINVELGLVILQTPFSGIIQYYKGVPEGEDAGEWRAVMDGHRLEGMLTRDLIRQIKGVPKL